MNLILRLPAPSPCFACGFLALTDLHANLYPYDYYRDCPDNSVGLARAASLVAEARKEAPNCLLFDDGDGTSVVIEAPDTNRDALLKFVESQTEIAPKSNGAWRFAPWPGAVVATHLTSPAASDPLAPPGLKLTSTGLAPGGFLKLRVETV
ncbi:MAG TPA: hypothetical protein VI256_18960 [Roseiarcus sp.]